MNIEYGEKFDEYQWILNTGRRSSVYRDFSRRVKSCCKIPVKQAFLSAHRIFQGLLSYVAVPENSKNFVPA